jgi:hypothetical protein
MGGRQADITGGHQLLSQLPEEEKVCAWYEQPGFPIFLLQCLFRGREIYTEKETFTSSAGISLGLKRIQLWKQRMHGWWSVAQSGPEVELFTAWEKIE